MKNFDNVIGRIFITGGSGFVGSEVVRQLVEDGREVMLLVRSMNSCERLQSLLGKVEIVNGSLHELGYVSKQIRKFQPQAILHLAWEGVKNMDRNSPIQIANISNTMNLFYLATELECSSFVALGSQAEYGVAPGKLSESALTNPTTLYGAAKLATCNLLKSAASVSLKKSPAVSWLRLFSSYGNGDDPSWLLPYLTNTLLSGNRPSVTLAEQQWDYIHVEDVARAIIAVMDASVSGVFNLGSGKSSQLRQIILTLRDLINPNLDIGFGEVNYRPDQVMHLEADIQALTSATGWIPSIPIEEGLSRLVTWHRERHQD